MINLALREKNLLLYKALHDFPLTVPSPSELSSETPPGHEDASDCLELTAPDEASRPFTLIVNFLSPFVGQDPSFLIRKTQVPVQPSVP